MSVLDSNDEVINVIINDFLNAKKDTLVTAKTTINDKSLRFCSATAITKQTGQSSPEHS